MIKYIIRKKIVYVLFISLFFLSGCELFYRRLYEIKPPQNIEIMEEMDVFFVDKNIWEKGKWKPRIWDEETNSYNYAKRYFIIYQTKKQKCSYEDLCIKFSFYIDVNSNSITNLRILKTRVHQDFNEKERILILKLFYKIKRVLKNKGSKLLEQEIDSIDRSMSLTLPLDISLSD